LTWAAQITNIVSKIFDTGETTMRAPDLSFREASALAIGALFLLLTFLYLVQVQPISWRSGTAPAVTGLAGTVMLVAIIGSVVLQSFIAVRRPIEANEPADERERGCLARAGNWSGLVLGAGCIMALGNFLVHGNGNLLFHGILLSLLISTAAESAFQLWLFRRQR
jgi:hypothetical protein